MISPPQEHILVRSLKEHRQRILHPGGKKSAGQDEVLSAAGEKRPPSPGQDEEDAADGALSAKSFRSANASAR